MISSNISLSRRLEAAEGNACMQFAEARRRLFPESGAEWIKHAGAYIVFDGVDSPTTQSFGLGIFEALTGETLDLVERFYFDRGAAAHLEISPFAGVAALDLLCQRDYRPAELSNVLYRQVEDPGPATSHEVKVRVVDSGEREIWNEVSARGWSHEHPELLDFLRRSGAIATGREHSVCFLASVDGQPGAAGSLCLHEGVALFAGAATVPKFRRRGLQTALLHERMRYAQAYGCDLAMMVAEPGSDSQRNAERKGFRVGYTRIKWQHVRVVV